MGKETSCSLTAHSTSKSRVIVLRFRSFISLVQSTVEEVRATVSASLKHYLFIIGCAKINLHLNQQTLSF